MLCHPVGHDGAPVHFAAFDALDGAGVDFTKFNQALLRQPFLLAQFCEFESELGLVDLSFFILLQGIADHLRVIGKQFHSGNTPGFLHVCIFMVLEKTIPGITECSRPIR